MGRFRQNDAFGRFVILQQLGSGGSAEVYKAWDTERSADVVLKMVPDDLDERTLKRFLAEARILARLNHPNVVKIYEVGKVAATNFYVMEWLEARSLKRCLDERVTEQGSFFTASEILSVFADLASALRYTHAQHVYHRDIKPGNVLIDRNFKAILMDFGLAKTEGPSVTTQSGVLLGTPLYMAPEQLQGKTADHQSDLYALGLVVYQMATGHIPFHDDATSYAAATRRLTEDVPPPSTVNPTLDPVLERVVLRCLQREKSHRWASADELLRALHTVPGFPADRLPRAADGLSLHDEATVETGPAAARRRSGGAPTGPSPQTLIGVGALLLAAVIALLGPLGRYIHPAAVEYQYGSLTVTAGVDSVDVSLNTTPALRCELMLRGGEAPPRIEVVSETPATRHRIRLQGLEPATAYRFRLRFIGTEGRLVETRDWDVTTGRSAGS